MAALGVQKGGKKSHGKVNVYWLREIEGNPALPAKRRENLCFTFDLSRFY